MPDELGKIEKPAVAEFNAERKLYFVPLIFSASKLEAELQEKIDRYWHQVEAQVANLEAKFGRVNKVYHEMVHVSGEDASLHAQALLLQPSMSCVRAAIRLPEQDSMKGLSLYRLKMSSYLPSPWTGADVWSWACRTRRYLPRCTITIRRRRQEETSIWRSR